jgi:predicted small metal-binding protein
VNHLDYKFKCSDIGLQCDFEANGETVAEVIKQATAHAMQAHRTEAIALASKIRAAVTKT